MPSIVGFAGKHRASLSDGLVGFLVQWSRSKAGKTSCTGHISWFVKSPSFNRGDLAPVAIMVGRKQHNIFGFTVCYDWTECANAYEWLYIVIDSHWCMEAQDSGNPSCPLAERSIWILAQLKWPNCPKKSDWATVGLPRLPRCPQTAQLGQVTQQAQWPQIPQVQYLSLPQKNKLQLSRLQPLHLRQDSTQLFRGEQRRK